MKLVAKSQLAVLDMASPENAVSDACRSLPHQSPRKWRMPRPSGLQARCPSRLTRSRWRWRLSWRQPMHLWRVQAVRLWAGGQRGWHLMAQKPAQVCHQLQSMQKGPRQDNRRERWYRHTKCCHKLLSWSLQITHDSGVLWSHL